MNEFIITQLFRNFRYDWCRKLERYLGVKAWDYRGLLRAIERFQREHELEMTGGWITPEMRLKLISEKMEFGIQIIGSNLVSDRWLLDEPGSNLSDAMKAEKRILEWGKAADAWMPNQAGTGYIWAVRGMKRNERGYWSQTDSAYRFAHESYGNRDHFSSAKAAYADTCFIVVWHDTAGAVHVRTFEGTCNPGSIWPHGTAHLCSGQYLYKLGRHRTREPEHIDAVLSHSKDWPEHWITDRTVDSVQYYALESVSPIEVVRSTGESLDISEEDIRRAEVAIAHRDPAYVDQNRIKINIHTCAENHASSLGCMNILPNQYAEFISILENLAQHQIRKYGFALDIPFYLCDASMLA
jgi:hypothetical protein